MEDSLPDPPLLRADTGCLETIKRRAPTSSVFFNFVVTGTPFQRFGLKEGCVLKECKGRKCIFILHNSPNRYLCLCLNHGTDRSAFAVLLFIGCYSEGDRQGCNPKQME